MSIFFRAMYRLGFTPWDSGVSPPELKDLIEGAGRRTPGKALDLGCGTGTNAIYMSRHGWDVTAIDFVPRAIAAAKAKAEAAEVAPTFIVGDVTRLPELGVGGGYTLAFDLGCFHAIPEGRRDAYVDCLSTATEKGADYLMWGFYARPNFLTPTKVTEEEVHERFGKTWGVVRVWDGENPTPRFPGRWYHLKRL
jgi:SAM-dependent methyltransferase